MSRNGRPYDEPAYVAFARLLKREPAVCAVCGMRPGTTVGHHPALALHEHIKGSGCCELRAECRECNYGAGAKLGGQRVAAINKAARAIAEQHGGITSTGLDYTGATFSREW